MKKIFSSIALAACAAMLAGCDDYQDRYTAEYASVARLDVYGEQDMTAWTINTSETYTVKILRSGHTMSQPVAVTARVMTDAEWNDYAATYGLKRFYKIPDNCFEFVGSAAKTSAIIDFVADQFVAETDVEIFCGRLSDYSNTLPAPAGDDEDNIICLPVVIESNPGSVMASQNTLLLKIISKDASIELSEYGFSTESCLPTSKLIEKTYTVTLSCENPWGFTAHVASSQSALDSYNAAHGTAYTLLGSNALEVRVGDDWKAWEDMDLEFPVGTRSVDISVRINPAEVGIMDALALVVENPSLNIKVDPAKLTHILAVQVKPSSTRLSIPAANVSSSSDDGTHTAKNLVDGKRNTYFTTGTAAHDGDPVYGQYVDFKLPEAKRYFAFDFMTRNDYFGQGEEMPNVVDLYASNDGKTWEKFGTINNMRREFNSRSQTVTFGNFDAGKNVSYIRWAVVAGGAAGDVDMRESATTAHWAACALYIFAK